MSAATRRPGALVRALRWGGLALWLGGNLAWLRADRLVRDGDEEGHVGAAELFLHEALSGDLLAFVDMAWRGSLGEYPPLFPAVVGGVWALVGGGDPGRLAVRGVCLAGVLLAALCMGRVAEEHVDARGHRADDPAPTGPLAGALAFVLTLSLPLAGGLSRHFMPEGLLVGMVGLAVASASWAGAAPSVWRGLVLGAVCGLGLLTKQTFVLYAVVPVVILAAPLRRAALGTVVGAAAVAGPWYGAQLVRQLAYVQGSVGGGGAASSVAHLLYYPALLPWSLAGPVVLGAALVSLMVLQRSGVRDSRRGLAAAMGWLAVTLALLTVIPKKYPRLGAPLGLPVVLLAALGLPRSERRGPASVVVAVGAMAWSAGLTATGQQSAPWTPTVDPRCEQRWLRPPAPELLGLDAVVAAVRVAPPGVVAVSGNPEIPCTVQTTHGWLSHLEPALRRAGLEREVVVGVRRSAAVQVVFTEDPAPVPGAQVVPLPALHTHLRLFAAAP